MIQKTCENQEQPRVAIRRRRLGDPSPLAAGQNELASLAYCRK
jgi:hypothetical protein